MRSVREIKINLSFQVNEPFHLNRIFIILSCRGLPSRLSSDQQENTKSDPLVQVPMFNSHSHNQAAEKQNISVLEVRSGDLFRAQDPK